MKPLPEKISFFRCFVPINCGFPTVPAQDYETDSLFFRRPPRLYLSRCPKPYNFKLFVFLLNMILKTSIFCFDDCCDFECLQFCNLSNIHPWAVQTLWKSSKAVSLFFFAFPLFPFFFVRLQKSASAFPFNLPHCPMEKPPVQDGRPRAFALKFDRIAHIIRYR